MTVSVCAGSCVLQHTAGARASARVAGEHNWSDLPEKFNNTRIHPTYCTFSKPELSEHFPDFSFLAIHVRRVLSETGRWRIPWLIVGHGPCYTAYIRFRPLPLLDAEPPHITVMRRLKPSSLWSMCADRLLRYSSFDWGLSLRHTIQVRGYSVESIFRRTTNREP